MPQRLFLGHVLRGMQEIFRTITVVFWRFYDQRAWDFCSSDSSLFFVISVRHNSQSSKVPSPCDTVTGRLSKHHHAFTLLCCLPWCITALLYMLWYQSSFLYFYWTLSLSFVFLSIAYCVDNCDTTPVILTLLAFSPVHRVFSPQVRWRTSSNRLQPHSAGTDVDFLDHR